MKQLLLSSTYALGSVFIISFVINYIFYLNTSDVFGASMAAYVSLITTIVAGITLIFYGYPVHYYLKKYNIQSYRYYLLSGSIPGVAIVFMLKPLGNDTSIALTQQALYFSILGIILSGVFWFAQVKRTT